MAGPVAGFVQLPTDSGNTGKKVRTETRVIGADTVHEHFFVPVSARSVVGKYKASTGTLTVPIAVTNGTTTGFAWLYNPVGSAVKMAVTRMSWNCHIISVGGGPTWWGTADESEYFYRGRFWNAYCPGEARLYGRSGGRKSTAGFNRAYGDAWGYNPRPAIPYDGPFYWWRRNLARYTRS